MYAVNTCEYVMLAFDWAQVSALKHSNLVEMLDAFDEEFHIHIVMTLCMGGYTNIKYYFLHSIAPLCLRGGCLSIVPVSL